MQQHNTVKHNSQTQPQNSLKLRNKLILSLSTELCHKNSMLGSQNGPLTTTSMDREITEPWRNPIWCLGYSKCIWEYQLVVGTCKNGEIKYLIISAHDSWMSKLCYDRGLISFS